MNPIRPARRTDLDAIKTCAVAAYTRYIDRIGKEPAPMIADFAAAIDEEHLYVLEQDGEVRGFVVFYVRDDHVHLENVAVDPGFQGRGLGSKLIEFVERQARAEGYASVELYTNAKMTENLGLYPRLGYREFDHRHEDGFDRVYFIKAL
ncbi:MAG: GNAT family N-acetyltransferase [Gammaproteobacteria bacterium]|nr:GNAT family N-acetyltransferase [Gammaproteobacteria bacterium]